MVRQGRAMVRQGRAVKGAIRRGSGAYPVPAQTCPRISDVCQLSSWEARAALIQFQTELRVLPPDQGADSIQHTESRLQRPAPPLRAR